MSDATKTAKREAARSAVGELIAAHDMRNRHPLRKAEIIAALPGMKPKHIKRALKELR